MTFYKQTFFSGLHRTKSLACNFIPHSSLLFCGCYLTEAFKILKKRLEWEKSYFRFFDLKKKKRVFCALEFSKIFSFISKSLIRRNCNILDNIQK